jgi:hypothetical protein
MKKLIMLAAILASFSAQAKSQPKKDELPICESKENVIKYMNESKFFPLLNMNNKEGVVETIWITGQAIAITTSPPKSEMTCLIAMMKDVVYNSDTVTGLYKVFEAQLNKEKGI